MPQPSPYSNQVIDAQDEALRRAHGVRFCGVMKGTNGEVVALFNDDCGRQTSFHLNIGQRLGEGLAEVDQRYEGAPRET